MPPKKVTRKFVRELLGRTKKRPPKAKLGKYAADDVELLFTYVADLRKDRLKEYLDGNGLAKGGSKTEVIRRLKEAIDDGQLSYDSLIELLDEVEPWGKQHIFILKSRDADPAPWKNKNAVDAVIAEHGLKGLLNKHKMLLLPDTLRLSTIDWSPTRLRVTAVERRVGYERTADLDDEGEDPEGDPVEFRAYVRRTSRGLIAFEWDLVANEAFLQITQLPSHENYDEAQARFNALVRDWLAVDGIIALVDEATGYQADRARDALALILEAFIGKELATWAKTFDDEFYRQMFRLRDWSTEQLGTSQRPPLIGKLTNNIVYERLAPAVLDELKRKNPRLASGSRRTKHHQWLTSGFGHPKLREHLAKVIALMQVLDRTRRRTFPRQRPEDARRSCSGPCRAWALPCR
jgi:hypothetical protein